MKEEKKLRILIASVLKPVDDTRMFGKIAQSIQKLNRFEIHVAGASSSSSQRTEIQPHVLGHFYRLNIRRFFAPLKVLRLALRLKPSLLIITTHELLIVAIISKLMLHCKVIYDVQENYYLNILHTDAFSRPFRKMLACYVRLKERLTSRWIDHFFLAEQVYQSELVFSQGRNTVLENKVIRDESFAIDKISDGKIRLIFTGTLSESTGVFTAIKIAESLYGVRNNIRLLIIGYCARKVELERVQDAIRHKSYISLVGGDHLVPHDQIKRCIATSDLGIIAYPTNIATQSKTPTKLYEYLGYKLPILLIQHEAWEKICAEFNAAIVFNPDNIQPQKILDDYCSMKFYFKQPEQVYWETEETKLWEVIWKFFSFSTPEKVRP